MHLAKFTDGWTRPHFMPQAAKSVLAAGVLAPLWDVMGNSGDAAPAYPRELLSLSEYTKGKLKAGEVLSAQNVDVTDDAEAGPAGNTSGFAWSSSPKSTWWISSR